MRNVDETLSRGETHYEIRYAVSQTTGQTTFVSFRIRMVHHDRYRADSIDSQPDARVAGLVLAAPKPSYWIDGQRVQWLEYVDSRQKTVDCRPAV